MVSIGHPEVWPLVEIYPPTEMPPTLWAKLEEADFYLVRLVCSFRPKPAGVQIEWARFAIKLVPDAAGRQAIAFDVHPLMVSQAVKRQVKVTLSPTLKFREVEASVGGAEVGIEYTELQPIISADGVGEDQPSWNYEEAHGMRVQGSKSMHLLAKAPKGMPSSQAVLDLAADVVQGGFRLPVLAHRNPAAGKARLTVPLWG